jgi:hypothetical protein
MGASWEKSLQLTVYGSQFANKERFIAQKTCNGEEVLAALGMTILSTLCNKGKEKKHVGVGA